MKKPVPDTPAKSAAGQDRERRLAAALRANLSKRKDRARQQDDIKPKPDR